MVKTKGEKLGWESLANEKKLPLREVVGEGCIVNHTPGCPVPANQKIIL